MGAMETERALQALKQLFEGAIQGKPLAPAHVETAKRLPKEAKKAEAPKPKGALKVEVKPEAPKDAEVVRKAIVQVGQEVGRPLTAAEKMTVFVSDKFRTTVGIENQRLLGGVSRLTREVDWQNPTTGEWEKARSIMGGMPKMSNLSEQDQMVLHEVRQAAFEHYYRNHDAIQAPGLSIEKVQEDPALKGASVERIQRDERQIYHGAKSGSPENTQAWAEDIEKQIIDEAKLPPETTITVTKEEANDAIRNRMKVSKDFEWLVKDGEIIEDPQIAQVVYDVISGDSNPTKEMLLVKGSQLKHGRGLDEGVQESPERQKFRQRLLKKVQESYGFSEDPRKAGSGATPEQKQLFEAITHEVSGFESGMPTRAGGRGRAGGGEFSNTMLQSIDNIINRHGRSRIEVDQARNFKAALEHFNTVRARGFDMDVETANLINKVDSNEYWLRFGTSDVELRHKLDELKKQVPGILNKRNELRQMERGWSSLYVSYEDMRLSWRSLSSMVRRRQDMLNWTTNVFESKVSESIERNEQQLIGYVSSDDFLRNRKAYLRDVANRAEIKALSGMDPYLDADGTRFNQEHRWYKEVDVRSPEHAEFLENIKNEISAISTLQRLDSGIELDTEMDKLKGMFSEWGDVGYTRVLNQRNGINIATLELFKEKGASIIYDEHGNIRALTGGVFRKLEDQVAAQMWALHQQDPELYGKMFAEWEGSLGENEQGSMIDVNGNVIRRNLTLQDFKSSAREISYLFTITGQRAQVFDKAATPFELMHRMDNPAAFAGQPAEGKIMFANSPFRWLVERWSVKSKFIGVVMRNMFLAESRRAGIDTLWEERLKNIGHMSPEFKRIAKYAFNMNFNVEDSANANHIKDALSVLDTKYERRSFGNTLKQFIVGNRDGDNRTPPTTLQELTKGDLREQILYREGMRLLDSRFSGSYHIMDAGWNLQTQQDVLGKLGVYTADNGVLLHESAKIQAGSLIDVTGNHKSMEEARHTLKEETFKLMGRFDPLSSVDALIMRKHYDATKWFEDNAAGFNIFHSTALGETQAITKDRPDLFIKAASMRRTMIDTELANMKQMDQATGATISKNGPVDYSKWDGDFSVYTEAEGKAIQKICKVTDVDATAYMNMMKKTSIFALEPETRTDLSNPAYAIYFSTVRKVDPRVQFLDANPDKEWRWSSRISASFEGHGAGGGFVRWAGDTENSRKALNDHLVAMLEAKDTKIFLMHAKPYFDTILFSGGWSSKGAVAQSLYIGWGQTALQDIIWDYAPTDMENSLIPTSSGQRAAGLGAPSIDRNALDHFEHDMEMACGELFHTRMPDFTVKMDKKFGLAWYPFGPHGRRIPKVRMYNVAAFGLIAGGLLAIGAFGAAKKGAKEAFGGSAGGDEGHG